MILVLVVIFVKINIDNNKIRPYNQFHSLFTSKYVPLSTCVQTRLNASVPVCVVAHLSHAGIWVLLPTFWMTGFECCCPPFGRRDLSVVAHLLDDGIWVLLPTFWMTGFECCCPPFGRRDLSVVAHLLDDGIWVLLPNFYMTVFECCCPSFARRDLSVVAHLLDDGIWVLLPNFWMTGFECCCPPFWRWDLSVVAHLLDDRFWVLLPTYLAMGFECCCPPFPVSCAMTLLVVTWARCSVIVWPGYLSSWPWKWTTPLWSQWHERRAAAVCSLYKNRDRYLKSKSNT